MENDEEIIKDFIGEYSDAQLEVEKIFTQWDQSNDSDDLNTLFRVIHSIKSNLYMMELSTLAEIIHIVEDILSQIRDKSRKNIPDFTILISVTLEQCKELSKQMLSGTDKSEEVEKLTLTLSELCQSSSDQFKLTLLQALHIIDEIGLYGNDYSCQRLFDFLKRNEKQVDTKKNKSTDSGHFKNELDFFCQLIEQIESYFPFWKNRSDRILRLVSQMNESYGYPIDHDQLTAAVYIHDIGMSFIPPQKIYIAKDLNKEDRELMHSHCEMGSHWLSVIPGWDEAAKMILQHHERYDGLGYPSGLAEKQICDGAKILAIGDTYASITSQDKKGQQSKPIMYAVSEVNQGAGYQFDPQWVEVFNYVIRHLKN